MKEFRLIIAGSRNFNDYALLEQQTIEFINLYAEQVDTVTVVSGAAKGADTLGERFSEEFDLDLMRMRAKWSDTKVEGAVIRTRRDGTEYNAVAGHNRNSRMAQFAIDASEAGGIGACICFWDGHSGGTQHMIQIAADSDLELCIVNTSTGEVQHLTQLTDNDVVKQKMAELDASLTGQDDQDTTME